MLRILHAADLHLDSPFSAFSSEEAMAFRHRQRQAVFEMAERCKEKQCDLLLLAGDVFDGTPNPETVEALQEALEHCGAEVFLAPGNHDPYTARSVWADAHWPDNVHIFDGDMTCVTLPELPCRVWGAAFHDREAEGLLKPIPQAEDGFWEIGVFHGDPTNDGPYHPISPQTLQNCGLDYLALGHIHKGSPLEKAGKTFYGWPGCAMGRGFDECGEKGVWYIELERGNCRQEFLPLSFPRFEILTLPAEDIAVPPEAEGSVCVLVLTGESDPVDTKAVEQQLKNRFLSLEVRDSTTPKRDIWAGCGSQTLRGMALAKLKEHYDLAGEAEKPVVLQAVRYLLAALEGREQP